MTRIRWRFRLLTLMRGFQVMLAVAGISWATFCLPIFRDQSRLAAARQLIIQNAVFDMREIKAVFPLLDQYARSTNCFPEIHQSAAIIQLRLLEDSFTVEGQRELDARMAASEAAIKQSLGCSPSDAYLWLVLFWLTNARQGFSEENFDLLRASYRLGPNEGWIAIKRSRISFAVFDVMPPDLADQAISEFLRLVDVQMYQPAIDILTGPAWRYRKILIDRLRDVPQRNAELLLKGVAEAGFDIGATSIRP